MGPCDWVHSSVIKSIATMALALASSTLAFQAPALAPALRAPAVTMAGDVNNMIGKYSIKKTMCKWPLLLPPLVPRWPRESGC